ncbi:unnamed protein product [Pedinophyceae sp. YPF-701]|nr:unnamed protein product [Pedinophyceae sp. YPF-701]
MGKRRREAPEPEPDRDGGSDSEPADIHDKLIVQKAKKRRTEGKGGAAEAKREREGPSRPTPEDGSDRKERKRGKKRRREKSRTDEDENPRAGDAANDRAAADAAPEGTNSGADGSEGGAPAGVTLIDGPEDRNLEMQALLRVPRYFTEATGATEIIASFRCHRCGRAGHMARDCSEKASIRPCYLCAQVGHNAQACPNLPCFRCGRPGHMARDCTNKSPNPKGVACLRCGSPYCGSVGAGDAFRKGGKCPLEGPTAQDLARVACYACGETGHMCCKLPDTGAPGSAWCFNCGEKGHWGWECERPRPPGAERLMAAPIRAEMRDAREDSGRGRGRGRFNAHGRSQGLYHTGGSFAWNQEGAFEGGGRRVEYSEHRGVTVGAAFLAHNVRLEGHDDPIRLDIWDTAGQERYANLAPLYYRGAAAALVVFDVGSRRTFDRARHWIEELQSRATNPMVACLVGNKIDIAEGQREVSRAEAEACAEQMGMLYRETSAKTGEGVSETVEMVAEKAVRLRNLGFGAAPAAGGSGQASGAPHADTAPS